MIPLLSVVIPTHNRADLLGEALQSLVRQTLPTAHFEVIVVDDGSTDRTADLCRSFHPLLDLRCLSIGRAGTAAAKNLGIFAARGALILFFDDDDIADQDLLLEHVRAHSRHPDEHIAVLGYTTWAPSLPLTEVMRFESESGEIFFGYPKLQDGGMYGFARFWTGRISCKRAFLLARGVFHPDLPVYEDVELGYRLSLFGLQVLFHRSAVSYMNRPITLEQVGLRCEIQGRSRVMLSRLHADEVIQRYCSVANAGERWPRARATLDDRVHRVREIEAMLPSSDDKGSLRGELYPLYRKIFAAFRLKGTVAALGEMDDRLRSGTSEPVEPAAVEMERAHA